MSLTQQAAGNITRWADPHGDSFGVSADVSYSFWGGPFAFTGAQQTATLHAMQLWSDVAQINFFVDNEDPEIGYKNYRTDLDEYGGTTNWGPGNYNPDETHEVGFNLSYNGPDVSSPGDQANQLAYGEMGFAILIHEIGHAIGFEHPDYLGHSQQYSTMSENYVPSHQWNGQWERTPLLHDIAAAQHFYGANMTTRTGDTIYGFNSNAGPAYALSSPGEQAVFTIYDAGGNDTLDLSRYTVNQIINLNPNTFSNTGGMKQNMSMADAVDVYGNNSWEAGFDPSRIANYIENAIGGSARDIIYGNATGNTLRGENGNDQLWGGDGWDRLFGGAGVDDLHGGEGEDELWGGSENDTLVGDAGDDSMFGGTGNDTYVVSDAGDTVTEHAGDANGIEDKVYTTLNSYDMRDPAKGGNVEILQFTGEGSFTGRGNDLHNILVGAGGGDRLFGYAGNDSLFGGEGQDTLDGGADNDRLVGEGGADTMYGGTGNDTFEGGSGADTMHGGDGNDTFYIDNWEDVVVERPAGRSVVAGSGVALIHGGVDQVFIDTNATAASGRAYFLNPANVEAVVLQGTAAFDLHGNGSANELRGNDAVNTIEGYGGSDTLFGFGGKDILRGGGEVDYLDGGEEDDVLDGGTGADTMRGGNGNDTYYVDSGLDQIYEDIGGEAVSVGPGGVNYHQTFGGTDAVHVQTDAMTDTRGYYLLPSNVEVALLDGGTAFDLLGNELANELRGNDAANTIEGYDGVDSLFGFGGKDTLRGGAQGDYLDGGEENDVLDGGTGADNMYGGAGDDLYYVDDVGDRIYEDPNSESVSVGPGGVNYHQRTGGSDTVVVATDAIVTNRPSYVLEANVENALLTGSRGFSLVGNELSNQLGGNDAANEIVGYAGSDLIVGFGGNDTLSGGADADSFGFTTGWGQDTITDFTIGQDVLDMSGVSGLTSISQLSITNTAQGTSITFGADSILLKGVAASTLNPAAFVVTPGTTTAASAPEQTLIGTAAGDDLRGGAGDDRLEGLDGMDFLTGGAGADQLLGGKGTDFLYVDADDTLIDGGDGFDYVYLDSSKPHGATFKVADTNVEYVGGTLADDVIDASGVSHGTVLFGNYGKDVLIGGSGNDRLQGSVGDDTMTGGAGNDTFLFASLSGRDTITDFTDGKDVLDMTGVSTVQSMDQLTITDTAQGALIAFGSDSIVLQGVAAGSLTASDFHFLV
jgi:Ca2+-binding RTX toxin-like protein